MKKKTNLYGIEGRESRVGNDDFLQSRPNQKLLVVLLGHGEGLVDRAFRNQSHLQFAVTLYWPFVSTIVNLYLKRNF